MREMKNAIVAICLVLLFGSAGAQGQTASNTVKLSYDLRTFARASGNVGGWWSFMNESEKSAFLDGYQIAMAQALSRNTVLCKILRTGISPSPDQQAFNYEVVMSVSACEQGGEFSGFEKVKVKALDDFYSNPINQPILLAWSLPYLRDRESARKTEGQLLDALNAEQKDVHDCSKYPSLCKLGIENPQIEAK